MAKIVWIVLAAVMCNVQVIQPGEYKSPLKWPNYDENLGAADCCPLVLKERTSSGGVPPDAIQGGVIRKDKEKVYYVRLDLHLPDWGGYNSGDGTLTNPGYWVGMKLADPSDWNRINFRGVYLRQEIINRNIEITGNFPPKFPVLTNPYQCTLGWWKSVYRQQQPVPDIDLVYPYSGYHYFARYDHDGFVAAGVLDRDTSHARELENGQAGIFHEIFEGRVDHHKEAGSEVLYINCTDSLRNILQVKMMELVVNYDKLGDSTAPVTIKTRTYSNPTDNEHEYEYSVAHEMFSSMEIRFDKESRTVSRRKWGSSFEITAEGPVKEIFKLGGKIGGFLNFEKEWEDLIRNGNTDLRSEKRMYEDKATITVPPQSKTTVSTIQMPVRGNLPFTAKYEIKSIARQMTPNAILKALERTSGISNVREENGTVVINMKGFLKVDSGFNIETTQETKSLLPSAASCTTVLPLLWFFSFSLFLIQFTILRPALLF